MGEGQQQIGRLRLQMKAGGDRRPLEGLSLLVLVVQELERRHVLPSPHDLVPAVLRQLHVRNVILLQNDPSKVENPDKNSMGASPPSPHPGDLSPGNPESRKPIGRAEDPTLGNNGRDIAGRSVPFELPELRKTKLQNILLSKLDQIVRDLPKGVVLDENY